MTREMHVRIPLSLGCWPEAYEVGIGNVQRGGEPSLDGPPGTGVRILVESITTFPRQLGHPRG